MIVIVECVLVCIVVLSIGYPFLLKEYDLEYKERIEKNLEQEIRTVRNRPQNIS